MRPEQLKELIAQDESIYLELKSELTLGNKESKAKFLKEVLSLANSSVERAYLIVGVRDKTKDLVGISGITEEQIQQVVANWCRPAIGFDFEVVEYEGSELGVMTIYSTHPPHTLKKELKYQDQRGKQRNIRDKQVFVRRGSSIDEAMPDEIVEMAQRDREDLSSVVSRLDRIADWQEEIAEALYSQNRRLSIGNDNWETWLSVPIFIALLTGALLGWFWNQIPHEFFPVVSSVISIFILTTFAVFRVSEFTFKQAFVGSTILAFAFWGLGKAELNLAVSQIPILRVFFASFVGAIVGGLPTSIVTMFIS